MPLKEVIVTGSLDRVNAILMTALTSALGMLPLAIASGAGNEILQPLAIVVLGGLFTSTALTLLVIPALYAKFGKWLMPKRKQTALEVAIRCQCGVAFYRRVKAVVWLELCSRRDLLSFLSRKPRLFLTQSAFPQICPPRGDALEWLLKGHRLPCHAL